MLKKLYFMVLLIVGVFLLAGGLLGAAPSADNYAAVITVTSGLDENIPDTLTLRQAVLDARNSAKPVLIQFDIPTTCPSYDSTLQVWKITFEGLAPGGAATTLRQLNGEITIDGTTQPGGRDDGPKIILHGHSPTGASRGLVLGETQTQNGNVLRGLAFQNFSDHVTIASQQNIVEDCWFGLNDAGTEPLLRDGNPAAGSGVAGIAMTSINLNDNNNIIRNNVFLGLNGTAATIRGRDNIFQDNLIGMRADGTVVNPGCTPDSWLGGGGVVVGGRRHLIEGNIIAGLRFDQFDLSQPPDALRVTADDVDGAGHTIRNNIIGLDINDTVVGTCGRGIFLSFHMRGTLIQDNTIVKTEHPAISLNGSMYNQCELRGNIIRQAEIEYGPGLPDAFKDFKPAKVTQIDGTTVTGTSGDGSPGPNCWIELFLDESDVPVEAREFLTRVQTDSGGNWTATIPFQLTGDQGIRTTTTTTEFGTIANMRAGTTTGLSELYRVEMLPTEPAGVSKFIAIDGDDTHYAYDYEALLSSYVAHVIDFPGGELYQHFNGMVSTAALYDAGVGYIDYQDVLDAYVTAVISGLPFSMDDYIASGQAMPYDITGLEIYEVTVEDGTIVLTPAG